MGKLMFVARRRPGLTPPAFVARWRQHGALAMTMPLWKRMHTCVQASVLQPAPITGASAGYNAIGLLWTSDAPMSAQDLKDVEALTHDEIETFAGYIGPLTHPVEEEVLKLAGPGRTTAFLFFDDPARARDVAEAAVLNPHADRVTLDLAKAGPDPGLPHHAIVEVAARDVEQLRAALGPAGASQGGVKLALVAREAIFWG
jgi:hypothetical protein